MVLPSGSFSDCCMHAFPSISRALGGASDQIRPGSWLCRGLLGGGAARFHPNGGMLVSNACSYTSTAAAVRAARIDSWLLVSGQTAVQRPPAAGWSRSCTMDDARCCKWHGLWVPFPCLGRLVCLHGRARHLVPYSRSLHSLFRPPGFSHQSPPQAFESSRVTPYPSALSHPSLIPYPAPAFPLASSRMFISGYNIPLAIRRDKAVFLRHLRPLPCLFVRLLRLWHRYPPFPSLPWALAGSKFANLRLTALTAPRRLAFFPPSPSPPGTWPLRSTITRLPPISLSGMCTYPCSSRSCVIERFAGCHMREGRRKPGRS